jgi:HSP20 family protein
MSNQNSDKFWQQHLKELETQNSAETFFINQLKNFNEKELFDPRTDFFISPLLTDEKKPLEEEGQLALDVLQNDKVIIIRAALAGVNSKDLQISLDKDVLTIRGERKKDFEDQTDNYYFQECYWGKFSRSIILPTEVDGNNINAQMKNGILTIILPKLKTSDSLKIEVDEIE